MLEGDEKNGGWRNREKKCYGGKEERDGAAVTAKNGADGNYIGFLCQFLSGVLGCHRETEAVH